MTGMIGVNSNWQESIDRNPLPYHLAALSIVLMTASIVYFDTFRSMVGIWARSDTFLHGFIILPLSVYLVWQKWSHLKLIPPRSTILGAWLLLGISTAWLLADVLGIQVGKHFAATAIIPAAILTVMGSSFVRAIAFPIAYLFFAVPFGEFWVPELMEITADLAIGLLHLTGIPVFRDELFLSTPMGDFEVAKACSGIRYLLATLALGTLYAYLNYHRAYKRLIFIAFSFVLPIIANGIRAYGIVAIAHYSDIKHAVGVDHIIYGWIFFGVVIGLMFFVGNRYRDADPPNDESASVDAQGSRLSQPSRLAFAVLAAAAAMTFGPLASQALTTKYALESELSNGLPNAMAGWRGTVLTDADWAPSFIRATQESLVRYLESGVQVEVALIRYAGQRQGSELANDLNSIFGNNGWTRRKTRALEIEISESRSMRVVESLAARNGAVRRFWHWYEVDGIIATSNSKIKLNEALSLLRGGPAISSAVIVSVIENGSSPDVLQTFMSDAYESIRECLGATAPRTNCSLGRTNTENN